MNKTIKNLVSDKIARHITSVVNGEVKIDRGSVDVKNGRIRFWFLGSVTSAIDLKDIDCTEDEAWDMIIHNLNV